MSVVGYDFGNLNSYIAVARQGGIDVLTNDYSLHATPLVFLLINLILLFGNFEIRFVYKLKIFIYFRYFIYSK